MTPEETTRGQPFRLPTARALCGGRNVTKEAVAGLRRIQSVTLVMGRFSLAQRVGEEKMCELAFCDRGR
jgi:hypothetical protein